MAAPIKDRADWYKHDRDFRNSRQIKAIRSKFKFTGYAIAVMLREAMAGSSNFAIPYASEVDKEMCAGDFGIDAAELKEILLYMEKVGYVQFSPDGKVYCPDLSETLTVLLEKRESDRERKKPNGFPRGNSEQHRVFHKENTQREEREKRREEESKETNTGEPDFMSHISVSHRSEEIAQPEGKPAIAIDPQFEKCWKLYEGHGVKKKALEYWRKLKQEQRDEVEAKIPAYVASTSGARKQYRKMFQGWINPTNELWTQPIVNATEGPKMKNGQWTDETGMKRMILQ